MEFVSFGFFCFLTFIPKSALYNFFYMVAGVICYVLYPTESVLLLKYDRCTGLFVLVPVH